MPVKADIDRIEDEVIKDIQRELQKIGDPGGAMIIPEGAANRIRGLLEVTHKMLIQERLASLDLAEQLVASKAEVQDLTEQLEAVFACIAEDPQ